METIARCYCGAVEVGFGSPPRGTVYCHCGQCRRQSGAAFTSSRRGAIRVERRTLGALHPELRARFAARLAEPDIHARLLSRIAMGNVVTDHELVTRNFPEGRGSVEMHCTYEVLDGHIQKATFAMGEK